MSEIKKKRPLIHHITNFVTINDCANIVLAIGGSPIMANDPAEAAEVTSSVSALVLNMGTPNPNNAEAMIIAGKTANEMNIPVVFDPVGAGSTGFRRSISERLLSSVKPTVIRGNMSEIMFLSGISGVYKGVDGEYVSGDKNRLGTSGESSPELDKSNPEDIAKGIAKTLAKSLSCVVAITGKNDVVTDGKTVYLISNGCDALSRVTGTGCMASSLAGTFCGASRDLPAADYLTAAAGGIMSMGIAGQLAYAGLAPGEGIGTFKVKLFDNIYNLKAETFIKEGKLSIG